MLTTNAVAVKPTTYQIEIVTPLALSAVAVLEQLRAIFGDGCWIVIARQPVPLHDMEEAQMDVDNNYGIRWQVCGCGNGKDEE